jgi:aldose 1-epimerase
MTFENEYGAFTIDQRGASIVMLRLGEQQLIHDFGREKYNWSSGAVMFPFPVRMTTGTIMQFGANYFNWPMNDTKHKAALHGLTPWVDFELTRDEHGITCVYEYDGNLEYYPFPNRLSISYALKAKCFTLNARIENMGIENMPYHLGWHPYFKLDSSFALNPSPKFRLEKDEHSLPGKKVPFIGFDWNDEVDGAFYTRDICVDNEKYQFHISSCSEITQIFRPKGAPFIAIEPITGLGHKDFPWRTVAPHSFDEVCCSIRL